jgi:hypothetical protein
MWLGRTVGSARRGLAPGPPQLLNGVRRPDRIVMFPYMKDNPAHSVKLRVFLAITRHVA